MQADFPAAHSMDSEWFAVDKDGHVGYFSTGADGAVPNGASPGDGAFEDLLDAEDIPEEIRAEWASRPEVLAELAKLIPAAKPKKGLAPSNYVPEGARHGLFVYGNHEQGLAAPYTRDWLPATPIHIDQLPPALREAVSGMTFKFSFADTKLIQPFEHAECAAWGPAWISTDGKTIRAVPGQEEEFAERVEELRTWHPEAEIEMPAAKPKKTKPKKGKPNK